MILIGVTFLATILIGIVATIFSFRTIKYSLEEISDSLRLRAYAVAIICFGFIIHTSGDFFGQLYSNEVLELTLESIAHVIIFVAIILFLLSTKKIMEVARAYKFN